MQKRAPVVLLPHGALAGESGGAAQSQRHKSEGVRRLSRSVPRGEEGSNLPYPPISGALAFELRPKKACSGVEPEF